MCDNTINKPLEILEYKVLGSLPDPFLMNSGERIKSPSAWEERRREIYKTAVELQYGTQPPEPEVLEVEPLYESEEGSTYRIKAGTREKTVSFTMKLIRPGQSIQKNLPVGKPAVIIDGDLSFNYAFDKNFLDPALDSGIAFALFDRTELAPDIRKRERRTGPLYDVYPEYTFGAIGAWAWGYSRCADALEIIGLTNNDCMVFSGHSRGGKTAMLAGALDERARIVNPNETCAGACGCYRIHMTGKNGAFVHRSETLRDLWNVFGFWIGPEMEKYADREENLPFDAHFLKAMVAPRVLLVGEAASDMWANPVGSWQTSMAAAEVFDYLGAKENMLWYFRNGNHAHDKYDIEMLVDVINREVKGTALQGKYFNTPFTEPELIYSWKMPKEQ